MKPSGGLVSRTRPATLIGGLWMSLALAIPLSASASHSPPTPRQAKSGPAVQDTVPERANPAAAYFTDTTLVDQNGQEHRFYSDLLQGKVVVISTIFTTCTGVCPLIGKTFARIQDHLGEQLGGKVRLISISVDPENDTPEKLRSFAARFGAREGWFLLTGRKENVEFILQRLGQGVDVKENHKAILLIGNEPTGLWKKAFALADPDDVIRIVDSVVRDSGEAVANQ